MRECVARSIAIFIAAMALSMRAEIVVFSECRCDPNPPFLLQAFVQRSLSAFPSRRNRLLASSLTPIRCALPARTNKNFCAVVNPGILPETCAGPARRASRKMLERIIEFVNLLGASEKIIEYNQEQARIRTYTNEISIVRSFPSKVGVS